MDASDGTIGRKLVRSRGIGGALRRDDRPHLAARFDEWVDDVRAHAERGEFLFSVNDYAVLLRKPPG